MTKNPKNKIPEEHRAFTGRVKMVMTFIAIFLLCRPIITYLNLSDIPERMLYSFWWFASCFAAIALAAPMYQTYIDSDDQDLLKWFHMNWPETIKECNKIVWVIFKEIFSNRYAAILSFTTSTITLFLLSYGFEFLMNGCSTFIDWVYALSPSLPMAILCIIILAICVTLLSVGVLIATACVFYKTYTRAEKRYS